MANPDAPPKPVLPLRTRIAVAFISSMSDAVRRRDGTINRRFLGLFDFKSPPSPSTPVRSVTSADYTVDSSRDLWFRLYNPTDDGATATGGSNSASKDVLPVMIFFHGGGFCYLSAASPAYNLVCQRFARRIPAVVISVEYRRAPEHRFPCQYDDAFDVLKYLDEHQSEILPPNADLSKCVLAGDSAGANIAHHLAVRACRSQLKSAKVIGLISIQPFFGGEERTESEIRLADSMLVSTPRTDWCWKAFLPAGSNRDHYAANVSGPNAEDISGLDYPRTLVFVGGFDPLQDWQRRYYNWLKKSGKEATLVEFPSMIHAFYVFPELPESSRLISQVKDFVHGLSNQ